MVPHGTVETGDGRKRHTNLGGLAELEFSTQEVSDTLTLSADGFLTSAEKIAFGAEGDVDLGTFILHRGGTIRGVVVDPSDIGVADAVVVLTDLDRDFWGSITGLVDSRGGTSRKHVRTDAYGAFELSGLRPGTVRLWAGAPGLRDASSNAVQVVVGRSAEDVRIRLQRAAREDEISGRVVLPGGASTNDLVVWFSHPADEELRTQTSAVLADGSFRIQLEDRIPHDVWVQESPAGWDERRQEWTGEKQLMGFRSAVEYGVPAGTTNLILAFEETLGIDVAVSDSKGRLLNSFELGIVTYSGEELWEKASWFRTVSHPVRMDIPASHFYVYITAKGHDREAFGPYDPNSVPDDISVALRRVRDTIGRVTAAGRPVENATVELFGLASREHRVTSRGFLMRTNTAMSTDARSNDRGEYSLTVRSADTYVIRAEAPGWAAPEIGPVELDPELGMDGLDLELLRGGSDRGLGARFARRESERKNGRRFARRHLRTKGGRFLGRTLSIRPTHARRLVGWPGE